MIQALLKPYLEKAIEFAFKLVQIWAWIITFFVIYVLISGKMWYDSVQKNAELKIELIKNQMQIDDLLEQQKQWELENENMRTKIYFVKLRIDSLESKLNKGLKSDEDIRIHNLNQSDSKAIELFTNRYGSGAIRHNPIRANKNANPQGNQRK